MAGSHHYVAPGHAEELVAALRGAAETARMLFGVQGVAINLADDDGIMRAVALTDGAADLAARAAAAEGPGPVGVTSFPLEPDGRAVGVMHLYESPAGAWPEDRVAAARAYAGVVVELLRVGRARPVPGRRPRPPGGPMLSSEEQSLLLFDATVLAEEPDPQAVMDRFAALTVPLFADWCLVYLVLEDGTITRAAVASASPDDRELAGLRQGWRTSVDRDHLVAEVVRTRTAVLVPPADEALVARSLGDPSQPAAVGGTRREAVGGTQRQAVGGTGVRSVLLVPLIGEHACIGVIGLVSTRSARYSDADLAFGTALAARLTTALERAWRGRGA